MGKKSSKKARRSRKGSKKASKKASKKSSKKGSKKGSKHLVQEGGKRRKGSKKSSKKGSKKGSKKLTGGALQEIAFENKVEDNEIDIGYGEKVKIEIEDAVTNENTELI